MNMGRTEGQQKEGRIKETRETEGWKDEQGRMNRGRGKEESEWGNGGTDGLRSGGRSGGIRKRKQKQIFALDGGLAPPLPPPYLDDERRGNADRGN